MLSKNTLIPIPWWKLWEKAFTDIIQVATNSISFLMKVGEYRLIDKTRY
jgi:hypothetical protein